MTAREFISRYTVEGGRVTCDCGGLDQWCYQKCPIKQRLVDQFSNANCSHMYHIIEKEIQERDEKIMEIIGE
jgi:hypothetical protein